MTRSEKNSKQPENYSLFVNARAEKELVSLPGNVLKKIDEKIQKLAGNPFPPGTKKLSGSQRTYRIRQGDYRIVYEVDEHSVVIMAIGHRSDIYR